MPVAPAFGDATATSKLLPHKTEWRINDKVWVDKTAPHLDQPPNAHGVSSSLL